MTPCLYILIRNDLASMVPGKAAAQASHATSVMMRDAKPNQLDRNHNQEKLVKAWLNETGYEYGTVIVLAASPDEIEKKLEIARYKKLQSAWVFDPTYPVKDGTYTHAVYLRTCAYIMAWKEDAHFLSNLGLW